MLDLNNNEEFGAKEFKVFNNAKAGLVGKLEVRVEKKSDSSNQPDYKLFAKDEMGEVNEGFYYSTDQEGNLSVEKFKKYQAQRLINLAKGVLGDDFKFPNYGDPKEALDGVMLLVANASKGKTFRAIVGYGTAQRPEQYLRFPAWGKFIQCEDFDDSLTMNPNMLKEPVKADAEWELIHLEATEESDQAPW